MAKAVEDEANDTFKRCGGDYGRAKELALNMAKMLSGFLPIYGDGQSLYWFSVYGELTTMEEGSKRASIYDNSDMD